MQSLVFKTPLTKDENEKLRSIFSKHISTNLKKLRKEKGITQQELAERAGLHLTYIGHLELGKYHPSTFILWKIAQVLDASLNDFISQSSIKD